MKAPNLRDPDDMLYVVCSAITAALILITSVVGVAYLLINAPSEAHVLDEGEDAVGSGLTVFCGIVFVICLALVIRDYIRLMRGCPPEERRHRYMRSAVGQSGTLFAVTAFFTIVVVGISYLIQAEISEDFIDKMSDYENIASMLIAGPMEEILCRMLLIGLPVAVVCAVKGRWSAKDIMGGFGMSKVAAVFLFISAMVFGLMHLEGWSFMKFPDTFITGILFGYVFIERGLHVTIFVHSAFDMMSSMEIIFGEVGELPMLVCMALGAVLLVRSVFKAKSYIPENNLHERFEGGLLDMWDRE